jgi:glutamate racemase
MDRRPLLFLDSGIGGVPYCRDFLLRCPREPLVYAADRLNFPYGKKHRDELVSIIRLLLGRLVSAVNPKMAVLAYNTASVSALDDLRAAFPGLPLVGTVPAVKPAIEGSVKRSIGVLGTERTVEDAYTAGLAKKYGPDCGITALAAPELVDFVENRFIGSTEAERREAVLPWIRHFREAGTDAVVLGCTHFLFLREEFRQEAAPDMSVYDSLTGISDRIESLLDRGSLRAGGKGETQGLFVLTGRDPPGPSWREWADLLGFRLSLLEDL